MAALAVAEEPGGQRSREPGVELLGHQPGLAQRVRAAQGQVHRAAVPAPEADPRPHHDVLGLGGQPRPALAVQRPTRPLGRGDRRLGSPSASSAVASSTRASAASAAARPVLQGVTAAHAAARRASRCRLARSKRPGPRDQVQPDRGAERHEAGVGLVEAGERRGQVAGHGQDEAEVVDELGLGRIGRSAARARPMASSRSATAASTRPVKARAMARLLSTDSRSSSGRSPARAALVAGQRLLQPAQPLEQDAVLGRGQQRGVARSPRPRPARSPRARRGPGRPGTAPATA